jgi:hypothetical protein
VHASVATVKWRFRKNAGGSCSGVLSLRCSRFEI